MVVTFWCYSTHRLPALRFPETSTYWTFTSPLTEWLRDHSVTGLKVWYSFHKTLKRCLKHHFFLFLSTFFGV